MSWLRTTADAPTTPTLPTPAAPRTEGAAPLAPILEPRAPEAVVEPAPAPSAPARPLGTPDLAAAATRALEALTARTGFSAWSVNRVVDDTYTPLAASATAGPVPVGTTIAWQDSLCYQVLSPGTAVVTGDVGSAGDAAGEAAQALGVRSYAGAPLHAPDGTLLGTVCATSPDPVRKDSKVLPLLEAHAWALGEVLARELAAVAAERAADLAEALKSADDLTELPDRRGWGLLLAREEERSRRLAEPCGVIVVDLGQLKTVRSVRRAVEAVREVVGPTAAVARLGGRQLGVLCAGSTTEEVAATSEAVLLGLMRTGTLASTGWAMRSASEGMDHAWWKAERDALAARRPGGR